MGTLRRAGLSLAAVNALDMVLQVLLPMVVVRTLPSEEFGQYRLLWLIITTALSILPLAMPQSLYYFLPRHAGLERSIYISQARAFMLVAGVLGGLATWVGIGHGMPSADIRAEAAILVACWVFASLLDLLFNAQQRNATQAAVNLVFSVLRFAAVAAAAFTFHDLQSVVIALLSVSVLKVVYCAIASRLSERPLAPVLPRRGKFWKEQLSYAAPLGVSSGVYLMRGRIDQWLVASLFSTTTYGIYSVALVFIPIQGLIRTTINSVVLPELNKLHAANDIGRMVDINRRANLAVAFFMMPTLVFIFIAAEPFIEFLFTKNYVGAAPIVRIYCCMLLLEMIEVTTLLIAHRQGPYLMKLDMGMLVLSVLVSLGGIWLWGLPGAAIGGAATALAANIACYKRCGEHLNLSLTELQDWQSLTRILISAILAGIVTALFLYFLPPLPAIVRLLFSGLGFAMVLLLNFRVFGLSPTVHQVFGASMAKLVWL